MPARRPITKEHVHDHEDGTIWAKGQTVNGVAVGYGEWFRKDGTKLRSGTFENGEQAGEWTTYGTRGRVYKVTKIKPRSSSKMAVAKMAIAKSAVAKSAVAKSSVAKWGVARWGVAKSSGAKKPGTKRRSSR